MNLFYSTNLAGNKIILESEEAAHATRTLRMREGEKLWVTDGQGHIYETELQKVTKTIAECHIINTTTHTARPTAIHLAIAPTKMMERLEWCLEKCTEIGISQITPLLCQRSERKQLRLDRCEKIVLSAMKQSGQSFLPKLNELTDFKSFVKKANATQKYIAHCDEKTVVTTLKQATEDLRAAKEVLILIGPEGDFTPEEIKLALQSNFKALSLGNTRLRTETAGVYAVTAVNLLLD